MEMLLPEYVVPKVLGENVTTTLQLPPGATLAHAAVLNE